MRYALMTNHEGGTVDDVLVTHLRDIEGPFFLMVVNAGNLQKVLRWLDDRQQEFNLVEADLSREDITHEQSMFAIQGPRSAEILAEVCDTDLSAMPYYTATQMSVDATEGIVSRTGYTG